MMAADTLDRSSDHSPRIVNMEREGRQIIGLDLLRFAAAMLVLGFHLGFWIWSGAPTTLENPDVVVHYEWLAPFTWFGWVGVQIFFVLSGFVIAYSAENADPMSFLRSRIVRLVPGAWVCATLTALVLMTWPTATASAYTIAVAWLRSIAFYPAGPWIDGSYWTLAIEIMFYGIVLTLLLARRMPQLPLVIGLIGCLSTTFWLVWTAASIAPGPEFHFFQWMHRDLSLRNRLASLLLVHHGCLFAIGVFLWLSLIKRSSPGRIAVILFCSIGALLQINADSDLHAGASGLAFSPVAPSVIWLGFMAAMVFSVLANSWIRGRLGSFAPFCRQVGLVTYPLYLLHQQISYALIRFLHGKVTDLTAACLAVVSVIGMAYVVATYIEPVIQRVFRKMLLRVPVPQWAITVSSASLP